jgi:site-specific recombinase XerD
MVGMAQLMNRLVSIAAYGTLIAAAGECARERVIEFLTANIRNRNTRRAYAKAVREFPAWCESHRVPLITAVQPVHVAGYIEELTRERSAPTAKQGLAAIRHLFDWLVVGQVKHGKTPVLSSEEARGYATAR